MNKSCVLFGFRVASPYVDEQPHVHGSLNLLLLQRSLCQFVICGRCSWGNILVRWPGTALPQTTIGEEIGARSRASLCSVFCVIFCIISFPRFLPPPLSLTHIHTLSHINILLLFLSYTYILYLSFTVSPPFFLSPHFSPPWHCFFFCSSLPGSSSYLSVLHIN